MSPSSTPSAPCANVSAQKLPYWSSRTPVRAGALMVATSCVFAAFIWVNATDVLQVVSGLLFVFTAAGIWFRAAPRTIEGSIDPAAGCIIRGKEQLPFDVIASLELLPDAGLATARPWAGYKLEAVVQDGSRWTLLRHEDAAYALHIARSIREFAIANPSSGLTRSVYVVMDGQERRRLVDYLREPKRRRTALPRTFRGRRNAHVVPTRLTMLIAASFMAISWSVILLQAKPDPLPISMALPVFFVVVLLLLSAVLTADQVELTLSGGDIEVHHAVFGRTVSRMVFSADDVDALRAAKDGYGRTYLVIAGETIRCASVAEPTLSEVLMEWSQASPAAPSQASPSPTSLQ